MHRCRASSTDCQVEMQFCCVCVETCIGLHQLCWDRAHQHAALQQQAAELAQGVRLVALQSQSDTRFRPAVLLDTEDNAHRQPHCGHKYRDMLSRQQYWVHCCQPAGMLAALERVDLALDSIFSSAGGLVAVCSTSNLSGH